MMDNPHLMRTQNAQSFSFLKTLGGELKVLSLLHSPEMEERLFLTTSGATAI